MISGQRSQVIIQPKSGRQQRVSGRITRREIQEKKDSLLSKVWSSRRLSSKTFKKIKHAAVRMGISPRKLKERLKQKAS